MSGSFWTGAVEHCEKQPKSAKRELVSSTQVE
jgi:hypothetical protein